MNRWVLIKPDTCIALVPKCASEMWSRVSPELLTNEQALAIENRIHYFREPLVDRLQSGFTFLTYGKKLKPGRDIQRDYEEYVDGVLSVRDDHWLPQTAHLTHEGVFMPTEVRRFEDIPSEYPIMNSSVNVTVKPYRQTDLEEYYKDDLEIWRSL